MTSNWTNKWKKTLVWFSAYTSFIAYALVGGYVIVKDDDDELKKTAKTAFLVTLIFACLSAFLSIFSSFAGMSDRYYSSSAYKFYSIATAIVSVLKILTYAGFIVYEWLKGEASK